MAAPGSIFNGGSTTWCRGNRPSSHLRHVNNSNSEISALSRPTSSTGTAYRDPHSVKSVERKSVIRVHDEMFSKEDVLIDLECFPGVHAGDLLAIIPTKANPNNRESQEILPAESSDIRPIHPARLNSDPSRTDFNDRTHDSKVGKRFLFIAKNMSKELKVKRPAMEVSISKHISDAFGLKHRSNVILITTDLAVSSASHVDLTYKDEYLSRSDMWRLAVSELSNKTVYRGQKILFMGTIKTQVASVFVDGRKVQSAFFSKHTKPVFRSESARYVIFIQMSREMWDFNSEGSGEIMFNKVVNGFLPALFKKWAKMKAKHLVSIVLFTRVEYDIGITSELSSSVHDSTYYTGTQTNGNKKPYKDFYRVVVSEMASSEWKLILHLLKREFKFFRRDISTHRLGTLGLKATRMEANPSLSMYGNVLEAINMATSQFAQDHIDRDLMRTGISIVVITPSAGIFEVEYDTLGLTTELLLCNGIGIDLVCLPKMPLHSTPIFRYRNPEYTIFQENLQYRSEDSTPRQNAALSASASSVSGSVSPSKSSNPGRSLGTGHTTSTGNPRQWCYAIPKWVDVSYWTGASQHRLGNLSMHERMLRGTSNWRSDGFDIRCKMYELEMSSVMEDAMSEISIMSLQQECLFPQMVSNPGDIVETETVISREKVYGAFGEYVNGPARPVIDRHSAPEEIAFYKALEIFDTTKSEVIDKVVAPGKQTGRRMFRTGSAEMTRKVLAEDAKVFGTSVPDDHHAVFHGRPSLALTTASRPSIEPPLSQDRVQLPLPHDMTPSRRSSFRNLSAHNKMPLGQNSSGTISAHDGTPSRKHSMETLVAPEPKQALSKAFRFGRQISFGKFGFGIAAPKAATMQIHTKPAQANGPDAKTSEFELKERRSIMESQLHGFSPRPQKRPITPNKNSKINSASQSAQNSSEIDIDKSPSQPIAIRPLVPSVELGGELKTTSPLGFGSKGLEAAYATDKTYALQSSKFDDIHRLFNSKLLAGAIGDPPTRMSHATLAPWPTVLNPSNPHAGPEVKPAQYRRWQYVYPRPIRMHTLKWRSLCSPASIPLTTEHFPTKYQLDSEYQQYAYNISRNMDDELNEVPKTEDFLRELLGLRLSQGFQIVTGPAVAEAFGQKSLKIANGFDPGPIAGDRVSVFMSMGNVIHQLSCVDGTEVEVNVFRRKLWGASDVESNTSIAYNPEIRTISAAAYVPRHISFGGKRKDDFNWNFVDNFVAGFHDEMSEQLRFWRARFVLIPIAQPINGPRRRGEDTPEEIRLEGIRKITQMWQRHRYVPPSERSYQKHASRKSEDPNPLDIVYRTEDPSVVILQEIESLALSESGEASSGRGYPERARFRKSNLDTAALAEAIQAHVSKGGIRMQNRRWHFRLHYNCFIGSDMTTWLVENFEDIEDREDAVELGNKLMAKEEPAVVKSKDKEKEKDRDQEVGIFVHVEKRHPFRDGQYFYQIIEDLARKVPDIKSGWFAAAKRRDASLPSTPIPEASRESPKPERTRSSSGQDETDSGATTPTVAGGGTSGKPRVALSKVMKFDLDTRKRSYRNELINLHYDRLHNPDACYHIRIDWVSVTAKLIEDAVESWATTAERYGLRLVEAPIGEACMVADVHPFRSPYEIKLAARPPTEKPLTHYDANSFEPQLQSSAASRHYYQKAILKKFNFVLDTEAARNFPSTVDVTYSWGKPDFKFSQYIHRSGVILAEITDEGNFLLVTNRLYNNRTAAAREQDRSLMKDLPERRTLSKDPPPTGPSSQHSPQTWVPSPMIRPVVNPITSPLLKPLSQPSTSSSLNDITPLPSLPPSAHTSRTPTSALSTPDASQKPSFSSNLPPQTATPLNTGRVRDELESFCHDPNALELFYRDLYTRVSSTSTSLCINPASALSLFTSPRIVSPGEKDTFLKLGTSGVGGSAHVGISGYGNIASGFPKERETQSLGTTGVEASSSAAGSGNSREGFGVLGSGIRGALGALGRRPSVIRKPSLQFGGIGGGGIGADSSGSGETLRSGSAFEGERG